MLLDSRARLIGQVEGFHIIAIESNFLNAVQKLSQTVEGRSEH